MVELFEIFLCIIKDVYKRQILSGYNTSIVSKHGIIECFTINSKIYCRVSVHNFAK